MSAQIFITTGCESSGKTTLASDLSRSLGLPLVPEISRDYLNAKRQADPGFRYRREDLLDIARRQHALESCVAEEAPLGVVCDTDLLVIQIWSEVKYGACDAWIRDTLLDQLRQGPSRHYLLCDWRTIPWEADPLRENPHDRDRLFDLYQAKLDDYGMDYSVVQGSREIRLEQTLARLASAAALVKPSLML